MAAGGTDIDRGNGVQVAAPVYSESTNMSRRHDHLLREHEHARQLTQLRAHQRQLARKRFFAVVNASEWDDLIEDDEGEEGEEREEDGDEDDVGVSPTASSSHGDLRPSTSPTLADTKTPTITRPPIGSSKSFPPPRPSVDGDVDNVRIATYFHDNMNFMNSDHRTPSIADGSLFKVTSAYPPSENNFATPIIPPFPPLTNSSESPSSSDSEDHLPKHLRSRFSVSTVATATPITSPITNSRSSARKSGLSLRLASLSGRASRALRRGTISGVTAPTVFSSSSTAMPSDAEKAVSSAKRRSAKSLKEGRHSFFTLAHTFSTRDSSRRHHPPVPEPIPVLPPLPTGTSLTFSSISSTPGKSSMERSPTPLIPSEIPSVAPSLPPVHRFARLDGDDDTIGYAYAHHYATSYDEKQLSILKMAVPPRSSSQNYNRNSQESSASKTSKPSQAPTPALLPGSLSGRVSPSGGESCLTTPDLSHSLPLAPPSMQRAPHRRSSLHTEVEAKESEPLRRMASAGSMSVLNSKAFFEEKKQNAVNCSKDDKLEAEIEVRNALAAIYSPVAGPSSALGLDLGLAEEPPADDQQARWLEKKQSVQSFNSLGTDYRIRPSDVGLLDDSGSEYEYEDYEPALSTRPHSVASSRRRRRRTNIISENPHNFRPSLLISPSSPATSLKAARHRSHINNGGRKTHTPSPSLSHRMSYYGLTVPPPLPSATTSARSSALTYASSAALTYGGRSPYSSAYTGVNDPSFSLSAGFLSPQDTPWQRKIGKGRFSRASIQTFGSSVLTYGSRASYLLGAAPQCVEEVVYLDDQPTKPALELEEDTHEMKELEDLESPDRSEVPPRPDNPLPWAPRPSSIMNSRRRANTFACHSARDSTSSIGSISRRPLPPIPTFTRQFRPLPHLPPGGLAQSLPDPPHSAGLIGITHTGGSGTRPRRAATSAGFTSPWSSSTSTPKSASMSTSSKHDLSSTPPTTSSPNMYDRRPLSRAMSVATIRSSFGTNTLGGGTGAMPVPDIEELVALLDEADKVSRPRISRPASGVANGREESLNILKDHSRKSSRKGDMVEKEGRGQKSFSPPGSARASPALKPSALSTLPNAPTQSSLKLTPPFRSECSPPLPDQNALDVPENSMTLEELRESMLLNVAGNENDDGNSTACGTFIGGTLISGFPLPPGLVDISLTPPEPLVPDSVKAESRTNSITPPPLSITKSRSNSLASSILLNKQAEDNTSESSCYSTLSSKEGRESDSETDENPSRDDSSGPTPPYPTLPTNGALTSTPPHIRRKRHHPHSTIDVVAANTLGLRQRTIVSAASRLTFDLTDSSDFTKSEVDLENAVIILPPSPTTISHNAPHYQETLTPPVGALPATMEVNDKPGSPYVAPLRLSRVLSTGINGSLTSGSASPALHRDRSSSLSTVTAPALRPPHLRSDSCISTISTFDAPKVPPLRLSRVLRSGSMLRNTDVGGMDAQDRPNNEAVEGCTFALNVPASPPPPPYQDPAPIVVPSDSSLFARQDDGPNANDVIMEPTIESVMASMSTASGNRETFQSSRDTYANIANLTLGDGTGYDDVGCSSLNTLASSINTEHQHAILGFAFETAVESTVKVSERKKSVASRHRSNRNSLGGKSTSRRRKSLIYSNQRDEEILRSLPDPSTFPIPYPVTGIASTAPSAFGRQKMPGPSGTNVLTFSRASPLPQLKLITDFSKSIPASVRDPSASFTNVAQPSSAVSTMSNFNFSSSARPGHARRGSTAASVRSVSSSIAVGSGKRRMNRQTLSDPRSPMPSAQVAAATLVARVKQKREAIAKRKKISTKQATPPSAYQNAIKRGQKRGTACNVDRRYVNGGASAPSPIRDTVAKGKARLGGSGFFGSTVRVYPDPVNRATQRPQRPFVKIPSNPYFNNMSSNASKGIPVNKYYFKNNTVIRV